MSTTSVGDVELAVVRVGVAPGTAKSRSQEFGRFEEERAAAKDALQRRVLQAGLVVILTAVCVLIINISMLQDTPTCSASLGLNIVQITVGSVGFFGITAGCVLMMLSDVDLEEVLARRPTLARGFVRLFIFAFTAIGLLNYYLDRLPVWLLPVPIWLYFGVFRLERTLNREPWYL